MPKTTGRRFLKRKIVTRHDQFSSDICLIFLRYRGPSNILHNKYTNVLCLLGTRGRENVFKNINLNETQLLIIYTLTKSKQGAQGRVVIAKEKSSRAL